MSKAVEILDAAETMIQSQGYNGFSFREIADQVGIKSASVHYHFPTKADLGAAVARRYTDRFLDQLPPAGTPGLSIKDALQALITAFSQHLAG